MLEMANSHAVQGMPNEQFFVQVLESEEMSFLVHEGFVCENDDPGKYQLTAIGLQKLAISQEIESAGNAFSCVRKCQCEDLTRWELMVKLGSDGWTDVTLQHGVSRIGPYTQNAVKEYYCKSEYATLTHPYLHCLVISQELFDKGASQIYHFQPKAYYTSLLALFASDCPEAADALSHLLQNQPRQYYLDFVERACRKFTGRSRKQTQKQTKNNVSIVFEEDGDLLPTPVTIKSSSRGRGKGGGNRTGRGRKRTPGHFDEVQSLSSDADTPGPPQTPESEIPNKPAAAAAASSSAPSVPSDAQERMAKTRSVVASTKRHRPARSQSPLRIPTSMLSETTVFFGDIPIIKRMDQGVLQLKSLCAVLYMCV